MTSPLDKSFALPAAALRVHDQRARLVAENIANADTPNFKARDLDFRAALRQAGGGGELHATNERHLQAPGTVGSARVQYRTPESPSLDGNTVETHAEQARFAETTVRYQAALNFLGGRIQGLIGAIKGE